MKHLLNNLSNEEKNSIREQHEGGISLDTSKFKKLLESQLGNVKPLVSERVGTTDGGSLPIPPVTTGGGSIKTTSTNKPPITNVPKDKEGRPAGSCWYGFNSTSKMFTEGPCKGIAGKDFTTQCKPKRPNCSMPGGSEGGGSISSTTGSTMVNYDKLNPCKPGDEGRLVKQGNLFALSDGKPFCKIISTAPSRQSAPPVRPTNI